MAATDKKAGNFFVENENQHEHDGIPKLQIDSVGIHKHKIVETQGIEDGSENHGCCPLHEAKPGEYSKPDDDGGERLHDLSASRCVVVLGKELRVERAGDSGESVCNGDSENFVHAGISSERDDKLFIVARRAEHISHFCL